MPGERKKVPTIGIKQIVYRETEDGIPIVMFNPRKDHYHTAFTQSEVIDIYLKYHSTMPYTFDLFRQGCVNRMPTVRPVICNLRHDKGTEMVWKK